MVHTDPGWQDNKAPLRMADHFWAEDSSALSTIHDRMQRSKRTCETILKMFEKRAQIEQEYGERLLKLSQIPFNDAEDPRSTVFETLDSLPVATEAAARAHIDLAQQIHHLLEIPLANFIGEQKALRKTTMESIDQVQNLRCMHSDNVKRARQAYITECENYERIRRQEPSDEELAEAEQRKAAVDHEYKLSLGILESVSKNWIEEWKKACDAFQSLEEKRLNYISGALLAYTNMVSNVYTVGDHTCERIRVALENMNVMSDMDAFIRTKGTGSTVPEIPKYIPFVDPDPAPAPRVVREINIPVVDEELRSVNEQLKLLPNARSNAKLEMAKQDHSVTPAPLVRNEAQQSRTIEKQEAQSPYNKALPSLPESALHVDNETSSPDGPATTQGDSANAANNQSTLKLGGEYHPKMRHLPSVRERPPALAPLDTNICAKSNISEPLSFMYPQEPKYNVDRMRRSSHIYAPEEQQQQQQLQHRRSPLTVDVDVKKSSEDNSSTTRKKKSRHAVFPFLKKSSPIKDRNRFSLAIFNHKKDESSPTNDSFHSPVTSPSPITPYTPPPPVISESKKGSLKHTPGLALEDGTPVIEYVQAQWSYDAKIDSEISFTRDDILAVIEKKRDGWWDAQIVHSASNAVNTRGLVPGNFMGSL